MKPEPNPVVRARLKNRVAQTPYLSSVTLAEWLFGIGAPPAGRRKEMLARVLDGLMGRFTDRVLPFDVDAARHHAKAELAA
jgi:predicted nucleic acid-binding protein